MMMMAGQMAGMNSQKKVHSGRIKTKMATGTTLAESMVINVPLNGVIPLKIDMAVPTVTMTVGLTLTNGVNGDLFGRLLMGAMHSGKMTHNGPITMSMDTVTIGLTLSGTIHMKKWALENL